jgi:hypothetical protein
MWKIGAGWFAKPQAEGRSVSCFPLCGFAEEVAQMSSAFGFAIGIRYR